MLERNACGLLGQRKCKLDFIKTFVDEKMLNFIIITESHLRTDINDNEVTRNLNPPPSPLCLTSHYYFSLYSLILSFTIIALNLQTQASFQITKLVQSTFNIIGITFSIFIFAILTTAVLIYCAIRFTKKQGKSNIVQDQQKLSDIQASMLQIQEQLDNLQSTVDLID